MSALNTFVPAARISAAYSLRSNTIGHALRLFRRKTLLSRRFGQMIGCSSSRFAVSGYGEGYDRA